MPDSAGRCVHRKDGGFRAGWEEAEDHPLLECPTRKARVWGHSRSVPVRSLVEAAQESEERFLAALPSKLGVSGMTERDEGRRIVTLLPAKDFGRNRGADYKHNHQRAQVAKVRRPSVTDPDALH